jgi:undecaprenyl-diphosphatase
VVNRLDETLARLSARLPRSAADPVLRELSHAANHSILWLSVAAGLASRRGPTRRAALRGVAAIAAASASANLVGKSLFPRRRPAAELIPLRRRVIHRPGSSSFPSGHAASAAAFTTAVALESPVTAAVLAPVAVAVAYSRVHTGVHWPTDVLAGAALGTGIGMATRRWWPPRADAPAAYRSDAGGTAVAARPGHGHAAPGRRPVRTDHARRVRPGR